jgi:NitT/TauT family transport system ATP-binding protein
VKAVVETRIERTDPHVFKSKAFVEQVDEIWGLVRDEALKAQAGRA